jgi:hypothetical protein
MAEDSPYTLENPNAEYTLVAPREEYNMPGWERTGVGLLEATGRGIFHGLGGLGDVESAAVRYLANPAARFLGLPEDQSGKTFFPTSAEMEQLAGKAGIPEPIPARSAAESIARGALGGAGATIPMIALGALNPAIALSGLVGGTVSSGLQQTGISRPLSELAGTLAGTPFGMSGVRSFAEDPNFLQKLAQMAMLKKEGSVQGVLVGEALGRLLHSKTGISPEILALIGAAGPYAKDMTTNLFARGNWLSPIAAGVGATAPEARGF